MAIAYPHAIEILNRFAHEVSQRSNVRVELIPVDLAQGRVLSEDVCTSVQTPAADTSAMDGYAVSAAATEKACSESPILLRVKGMIAAGDRGIRHRKQIGQLELAECSKYAPCVEIMTGARFPQPFMENGIKWELDACVRLEDVEMLPANCPDHCQLIAITKPVKPKSNRRLAGEDFARGDMIVAKGSAIQAQHIMALASLGVTNVEVFCKLKIGVISTGNEIVRSDDVENTSQVMDANGPFLKVALQQLGIDVHDFGIIGDDPKSFCDRIGAPLKEADFDVLITTGGVSCGRYDFVKDALLQMGGLPKFHRVAVRPGHPILFGSIPSKERDAAFFGLPGNPLACVVCFRFFVVPYLRMLYNSPEEETLACKVCPSMIKPLEVHSSCSSSQAPSRLHVFRLGARVQDSGETCVKILPNQGSHRIKPLLDANCWAVIPANTEHNPGSNVLYTLPLHATSLGSD